MAKARTLARIAALAWHLSLSGVRLGCRLALNQLAGRRVVQQIIIGRTLAELFERLGPTYIKLGQILSTRRDILSEPMTLELARLQDRLQPSPFQIVPALFREELHLEIEDVFTELEPSPIASASIASVYRGRLSDGRTVAVKILRPEVGACIRADLRLLRIGSSLLSRLPLFRHIPLRLTVDEFGVCLERQLDFRIEAEANRRVSSTLVSEPNVSVPSLVEELCSSSILTMQFIGGLNGTSGKDDGQARAALLAALRTLYRMIFIEGFIHCDLHQGNLHFLPDGHVVLIDFGFIAEMKRAERLKFAEFFYAISTNDGACCARIMLEMAIFSPPNLDENKFKSDVAALVKQVSRSRASEFQVAQFVFQLFNIQRRHKLVGTTAFIMAIVSLLVFEGIAKDIYPELDFQREALPFILRASLERIEREPVTWSGTTPPQRFPDSLEPPVKAALY
jgi:ubiquinone biosynthesis protein